MFRPILSIVAIALLRVSPGHSQTVDLIKMPLAELQAKAEAGDAKALVQLGVRYNLGIGLAQNGKKMEELIGKAADLGYATAVGIRAMNEWGGKDFALAFASFEKAAGEGDLTAIRNLGRCYMQGMGCAEDKARGFKLLQKAADSGDPAALHMLGQACLDGTGTEKDPTRAITLLEAAGAAGNPGALHMLGDLYNTGNQGVTKDMAKARSYYRRAGEMGREASWESWMLSYLKGTEHPILVEGIRDGRAALDRHPGSISLRVRLGKLIAKAGEVADPPTPQASALEAVRLCEDMVRKRTIEMSDGDLAEYYRWMAALVPSGDITTEATSPNALKPGIALAILKQEENAMPFQFSGKESLDAWGQAMSGLIRLHRAAGDHEKVIATCERIRFIITREMKHEPWQFFLRTRAAGACLSSAWSHRALKHDEQEYEAGVEWLRLWGVDYQGVQAGDLPQAGAAFSKERLQKLRELLPVEGGTGNMKTFNIPMEVAGETVPVSIVITNGLNEKHECRALMDQVKWLKEMRGVDFPPDVLASFSKLGAIAAENKVPFIEICKLAMEQTNADKSKDTAQTNPPPAQQPNKATESGSAKAPIKPGDEAVEVTLPSGKQIWIRTGGLSTADALIILAGRYFEGTGVEKNQPHANELFQRAGELGSANGYFFAGQSYARGSGIEKNLTKAFWCYRKAAELHSDGADKAHFALADCYKNGLGIAKDATKANFHYLKAGELGVVPAWRHLGINYLRGVGVEKNLVEARRLLEMAGELGDIESLQLLASGYSKVPLSQNTDTPALRERLQRMFPNHGWLPEDKGKADAAYRKVFELHEFEAKAGNTHRWMLMGEMHLAGHGVEKDAAKAKQLYEKGAEMGDIQACLKLAMFTSPRNPWENPVESNKWWKRAGELGDAFGYQKLGENQMAGIGCQQDFAQANESFEKAAQMKSWKACIMLADNLVAGKGCKADAVKANAYYHKAGDLGSAEGYHFLALNYQNSVGVKKDMEKALLYFRKGAELGFHRSMNSLGFLLLETNKPESRTEAFRWWQKAADGGYAKAQFNLGRHYTKGTYVKKDYPRAFTLFQKAAAQNMPEAMVALAAFYDQGLAVTKNRSKGYELLQQAVELGHEEAAKILQERGIKPRSVPKANP